MKYPCTVIVFAISNLRMEWHRSLCKQMDEALFLTLTGPVSRACNCVINVQLGFIVMLLDYRHWCLLRIKHSEHSAAIYSNGVQEQRIRYQTSYASFCLSLIIVLTGERTDGADVIYPEMGLWISVSQTVTCSDKPVNINKPHENHIFNHKDISQIVCDGAWISFLKGRVFFLKKATPGR